MEALTHGASGGATPPGGAGGGALVFIGFMGAGKTSSARAVAAELGVEPLDSDRALEAELGEPIEGFFDREGEPAFRAREEELVLRLLERAGDGVVALGGGALDSERVREALAAHTVVHLEVDPGEAWRRATGKGRPLARDRGRFEQLHADRAAGVRDGGQGADPAQQGATWHAGRCPRCWRCVRHARSADRSAAGVGAAHPRATRCSWAAACWQAGFFFPLDGRRFAVTDENVAGFHRVDAEHTVAIPAGEETKVLDTAELVLRRLAQAGAERQRRAGGGGRQGSSATRRLLRAPCTSAACAPCRCPPRWWPRWTPPTAGRRRWTFPRARTTWARTTSRPPCSATPRRWTPCPPRSCRRATPRW